MDESPYLTVDALRSAAPTMPGSRTWRFSRGGYVEIHQDGHGQTRVSLNYNRHDLTANESTLLCQLIDRTKGLR